ncbi:MAG: trypsin-like serine protease [Proteobacteria bacterium]|nr:MAG: trypsin-like serine protease [Pseudomonadota bacterium]
MTDPRFTRLYGSLTIALLLMGLSACNGGSGPKRVIYNSSQDRPLPVPTSTGVASASSPQVPLISGERKEIEAVVSKYEAHCADSSQCPSEVALLTALGDSNTEAGKTVSGRCTAFLISDRHLMTNRHCVEIGKNLSYVAVFPGNERFPAENIRVSQVLRTLGAGKFADNQETQALYQDAAILELERPTSRPSLKFSGAAQQGEEKLQLWSVDPRETGGEVVQKNCVLSQSGVMDEDRDSTRAYRQVMLRDCDVVHGNSGSPILNLNGEVVALTFATIEKDKVAAISAAPESWRESIIRASFSYANRLGCFPNEFFAGVQVHWTEKPVCETYSYYKRDTYFPNSGEVLSDRKNSSMFVAAPDDSKFVLDRLEEAHLVVPGCVSEIGVRDLTVPVMTRSVSNDDNGRLTDQKFETAGTRTVQITVKSLTEIEGMKIGVVSLTDGSAKNVVYLVPQCSEPIIPGLIPEPMR